jgi:hypothetical protein
MRARLALILLSTLAATTLLAALSTLLATLTARLLILLARLLLTALLAALILVFVTHEELLLWRDNPASQ